MTNLLELADRVERADPANHLVLAALEAEIGPLIGLRFVNEGHPLGGVWYDEQGCVATLPRFLRSIDAAMKLVPEGWRTDAAYNYVSCWRWSLRSKTLDVFGGGPTPAQALTAACLRAIASMEGNHD